MRLVLVVSIRQNKEVMKSRQHLKPLKPGDLIDIVAPGSATNFEFLQNGIVYLEAQGFKTRYPKEIIKPLLFLAQSDEFRFQSLKKALYAKDSKAIWCLRGGYGSIRLLPFLDKLKKPSMQKLLIGMSDITSLHLYLNQKWNWPTLHAPLLDRIGKNLIQTDNLQEVLKVITEPNPVTFHNLRALNKLALGKKNIRGKVRGGNLVVVGSSLGTKYQIDSTDCILFFEEIGERAYRVDRILQQCGQAGVFRKAKAVVFGDFTDCLEPDQKNLIPETLKQFFEKQKIPAFFGLQAGHDIIQRPIFFNTEAQLSCGPDAKMLVYSGYEIQQSRK